MCIKLCDTGGEAVANHLADKLVEDGYNVLRSEYIGYGCHMGLIRNRLREPFTKPIFKKADTLIVLTCTDGWEKAERVFSRGRNKMKKLIQASATVGIGVYSDEKGMRVCNPTEDIAEKYGIQADIKGTPLEEVAKASNGEMHAGGFE